MPPDGKLDASGSPWISYLPENSLRAVPSSDGDRKLSCFSPNTFEPNKEAERDSRKFTGCPFDL